MGDFGRYVVESGMHNFSRYRFGQEYPERRRKPRFIKPKWAKFVASLTKEQQDALDEWLRNPEQRMLSRFEFMMRGEEDPLTDEQYELLDAAFVYPKPVNDEYPTDIARRWVLRRTLSLGWTPEFFGQQDRSLGHGVRGREGHKSERWGKKYQWMAYHELLARVADNYQASRRYDDSEPYEGLHQITAGREIDPSLPPLDFRAFSQDEGTGATAWERPLIQLEEWPPARLHFKQYQGDVLRFLADTATEPTITRSLFVRDRDGHDWVVLNGYMKQIDPLADKGWRGLQETIALDTVLITAGEAKAFLATVPAKPRVEIHDLIDSHGHIDCCYVGEVGRIGPACSYHRHDKPRQVSMGGQPFQVVPTVERYTWEGNILDCSISESASTVLPSTFLQQVARLSFDMCGPSWLDADGTPVFTYYEEPENSSRALLVRTTFLGEFLTTHKLELEALHWFQRLELSERHGGKHPQVQSAIEARLGSDLVVHEGNPRREEHDLT